MKIKFPDKKLKDLSQNLPTDGEHHRYQRPLKGNLDLKAYV